MRGTFTYHNPTKLYFGEDALDGLKAELEAYGDNVVVIYGGGSIKRNGVYDQVMSLLRAAGKTVAEISGVMANPTVEKLREGVAIARAARADMLLAVGGGSVCDYSKAVAASINCDDDPWAKYFVHSEDVDCEIVPVGCVLTMAGTGSEMNANAVITDPEAKIKVEYGFGVEGMPRFAILNPQFTLSLPHRQVVAGIYDSFNHICEQYFSDFDNSASDYLAEGLMRCIIDNGRVADWMVHMIGHAVGGVTDATHGMTLSAVSLPYYRFIMEAGLLRFVRFATQVWGIDAVGKTDREVAEEGLDAMEAWMRELGLAMSLSELGATEADLDDIVDGTFLLNGGYKALTKDDVRRILKESM